MLDSISFIVATYNSKFDKIVETLDSILIQKNVQIEIIIADDGSEYNFFTEIKEYFEKRGISDYKLVGHEQNVGTCSNIFDGLKEAKYEYIKLISPGDMLYDENVICNWIIHIKDNNAKISFGNIVAYRLKDNEKEYISVKERPVNKSIYKKVKNDRARKINYILLNDTPVGAAFISSKDLLDKYLRKIVGKVRYAEDFSYRLMVIDNILINYYDNPVILYEHGSGISTSKNDKWAKLLDKDLKAANQVILEEYSNNDGFSRKYSKILKKDNEKITKLLKAIYFPEYIYWNIRKKIKS